MTTLSIAKHSAKYHKLIRDEEINHIFKRSRILLRQFTVPQAIDRLQQTAVSIKANLMNKDWRAIALDLAAIHAIAAQYFIIDYLLSELNFSGNQSQGARSDLPLNCTLVDIFLLYIREDDEMIRQECAALLQISIEQIGRAKRQGKKESLFSGQVERILEQFPFELMTNSPCKNIVYLLNSLQEIALLEDYWYKNEYFCSRSNGVFQLVERIITQNHSNNEQLIESAVNLGLIYLYHVVKQALGGLFNYSGLIKTLKTYLIKKIANNDYCDIDFKKLKVLIMSKVEFDREEFQIIQGLLETEIKKENYFYFVAINILTHYSNLTLKIQSIKHLIRFLLREHQTPQSLSLAQIIASLNFKNAKLFKDQHASEYAQYLLLMAQYFDADTLIPIIQAPTPSNLILVQQIISTLQLLQDDVASIDPNTAIKWRMLIESGFKL